MKVALASEFWKIATLRSGYVLWFVAVVTGPVVTALIVGTGRWGRDATVASAAAGGLLLPIIAFGVWGAVAAAAEFPAQVSITAVLIPVRRSFVIAKGVVVGAATFIGSAVSLGLSVLMVATLAPTGQLVWGSLARLLAVPPVVAAVAVTAAAIGLITRDTTLAVVAVIVAVLLPKGIGPFFGAAEPWFVGASPATGLADAVNGSGGGGATFPLGSAAAIAVVLLVAGAATALAAFRVSRVDLP